jgi:tetratricopeptide (TPR) repeat protein
MTCQTTHEATTLNNIGHVYSALGDKRKALDFYEQALPLRRQVGDRWGERTTRYNMGMVYEGMSDLARAEEELKIVVELDADIEHPDLASDRAALGRIQAKRKAGTGKS